jgi:bilirubin oxidase
MSMMNRMMGEEQEFDIFQIDARKVVNGPVTLPSQLVSHSMYRDIPIQAERSFSLQMMMNPARFMTQDQFSINGKAMDMNRIDEVVKAGSVEVWKIKNLTMMPHPFHIHNVQFKIIKRRGRIKSHELGFKDTVLVHPNETVHLMIHFPEYRDAVNPYMYHCHILEHEDQGMMGQFVVT